MQEGTKGRYGCQDGQESRMKPLSTDFTRGAFRYRQVERLGDLCIYHQTEEGEHRAYEVVKVRRMPERQIMGRTLAASEVYPRSEDWGVYGWTCQTLERARTKLAELQK